MKKVKLFICLLTVLCAYSLCACSQSKSVISDEPKRIYTANELNFIDEYLKASKENLDLSETTNPPNDPTSSDFAVITLNKQYYATDAFAFLPLKFRQLTKNELLQLVKIYGNINPKEILDHSSYQKGSSDITEINSNRELSAKEVFKSKFELLARYFNEGLRPKEKINTSLDNGNPLCISVHTLDRFWIYPEKEMTEEQLLQTIDALYGNVPSEWYSATSEQISHTEAAQAAKSLSKQYQISNKALVKTYSLYESASPGNENMPVALERKCGDIWNVYLHFKSGHDYAITLNANDGTFQKWVGYPKNFFSEQGHLVALLKTNNNSKVRPEEEYKVAAQDYVNKVLSTDEIFIMGEVLVDVSTKENPTSTVTIKMSTNQSYRVSVSKDDLSITGLALNL